MQRMEETVGKREVKYKVYLDVEQINQFKIFIKEKCKNIK